MALHEPVQNWTKFKVTSTIGMRGGSFHKGIDLATPTGTPVYAMDEGVIAAEGYGGSIYPDWIVKQPKELQEKYRKEIVVWMIMDNGWAVKYGHMNDTTVDVNQRVRRGDLLGHTGNTGVSTGPHIHIQMEDKRRTDNSKFLDFREYMEKAQVSASVSPMLASEVMAAPVDSGDKATIERLQSFILEMDKNFKAQMAQVQEQMKGFAQEKAGFENRINSLSHERDSFREERDMQISALTELRLQYDDIVKENEGYKLKINNLEKMIEKLTDKIHELTDETAELNNRNTDINKQLEEAKGRALPSSAIAQDRKSVV